MFRGFARSDGIRESSTKRRRNRPKERIERGDLVRDRQLPVNDERKYAAA